ncbi:MAG: efflux RND transporter periplasmic adaptor subunit [Saprospiraceae bacterium]|jgi:HlyD family secretion protein|tara:strand:+ start:3056 stop:4435 length:1380 start_codon:yes stop_codon:yes gene_type:complete
MTTKKKKSRKWLVPVLIIGIGALIAAAYFKGQGKPKGIEVTVEEADNRTILEKVTASGKIFPETEVKISSDVSGEIVELYVQEGDSVYIGQVLAKIDPDTYESTVERGRASVNSAKANKAASATQIESSKAQIQQIQAQLTNAKTVHDRNVKLLSEGVISQVEFDQSLSALQGLVANMRSAEATLESAKKNVEGASYSVQSAEATLREMRTSLSRTIIKSPTNGIVSSLSVEQGERVVGTIQMAGTEMMRIANLSAMEVQVDVSENDILRVSLNDKVDIEVDAYLDRKFSGYVTEIANSASNIGGAASLNTDQVTNFVVKVRVDSKSYKDLLGPNKRYPFRPGMSASVDIRTETMDNVLAIPIQAVTVREKEDDKDNKNKKAADDELEEVVFVMEADTVRMVNVTTGIQDDEYILVTSGLEKGEVIITGPYSAISKKLDQGDAVRVKEEKEKNDDEDDE